MVFAFYGISSMVDYCHPISNVTKYHHKSPHIYTIARNMYILQYIRNGNNKCYSRKMSFLPKKSFGIYIPIYTLCFLSLTIFPKRHRCAFWQVKRKETEKRYNTIYLLNTFSYLGEIFPFSCILHFSAKEGINDATKLDYFISSDFLMKRTLATKG